MKQVVLFDLQQQSSVTINPIVYSDSSYPLQTHCESSHKRVWPFLINVYYFMSTRKQSIEEETTIFNYFIALNQTS